MPRVGLSTVKETSNDVADTCSNRSGPGNIVFFKSELFYHFIIQLLKTVCFMYGICYPPYH